MESQSEKLVDPGNFDDFSDEDLKSETESAEDTSKYGYDSTEDDIKPEKISWFRKLRRLIVIEPYYMLFVISGFPSYTLKQQYFYYAVGQSMGIDTNNLTSSIENETCGVELNDTSYQQRERVQAQSANLSMYIELATFLPSMISMLLYGAYSDKIGRKLLFILPPIGSIIDVLLQMAIIYFELPVWVFFFSRIGSVFFGDHSLVFIAMYSYIADTVPPHKRAIRMIIIDVIGRFLGGFVQLGIGYWIKESYFWPYVYIGVGFFLSTLYAIFLIPETVQRNPLSKFKFSDVKKAFTLYITDDGSNRRWKLQLLTMSLMVEILFIAMSVDTLFEMNAPLCWNSVMIGYYGAARDTIAAIGGVAGVFLKRCLADHWLAFIGKITYTAEMLYMSMVRTTLMMYFGKYRGHFWCTLVSTSHIMQIGKCRPRS